MATQFLNPLKLTPQKIVSRMRAVGVKEKMRQNYSQKLWAEVGMSEDLHEWRMKDWQHSRSINKC